MYKATEKELWKPGSEARGKRQEAKKNLARTWNWLPVSAGNKKLKISLAKLATDHQPRKDVRPYIVEIAREYLPDKFETGLYGTVVRSNNHLYKIGEVVWNKKLAYPGVVTAADSKPAVESDWLNHMQNIWRIADGREIRDLLKQTWYLLRIQDPVVPNVMRMTYVPESYLRTATSKETEALLHFVEPSGGDSVEK